MQGVQDPYYEYVTGLIYFKEKNKSWSVSDQEWCIKETDMCSLNKFPQGLLSSMYMECCCIMPILFFFTNNLIDVTRLTDGNNCKLVMGCEQNYMNHVWSWFHVPSLALKVLSVNHNCRKILLILVKIMHSYISFLVKIRKIPELCMRGNSYPHMYAVYSYAHKCFHP